MLPLATIVVMLHVSNRDIIMQNFLIYEKKHVSFSNMSWFETFLQSNLILGMAKLFTSGFQDGEFSWTINSCGHFFSKWANSSGYFLRVNSGGHFWLILVDKNVHEHSSSWVNFCGHILGEF